MVKEIKREAPFQGGQLKAMNSLVRSELSIVDIYLSHLPTACPGFLIAGGAI
jgi:hypothetical protein